jgi:CheY-like chemotaxis protein
VLSSNAGIPVGAVQVGSGSRRRNGEITRPARADSTWRRKAAEVGRMAIRGEEGKCSLFVRHDYFLSSQRLLSNFHNFPNLPALHQIMTRSWRAKAAILEFRPVFRLRLVPASRSLRERLYWQNAEIDLSIFPPISQRKVVISAMASFAHTQPAGTFDDAPQDTPTQRQVRVLVASPQLEVRQVLIRTLDRLSADVISCSTRSQAEEVLARQEVDLVFCDEHLPDGSYSDLIHTNHSHPKIPRIVVATRHAEWGFYFEALRKGAFDITRSPWHATDIEMVLIRALRDECQQTAARQVA